MFNKGLVVSLEKLIQSQIPGLGIVSANNHPGAGNEILLHNGISLFQSNFPLIVLDGAILSLTQNSVNGNPLGFLNPADVASVSLLRDGAAALYGPMAANGVLVIQTKGGSDTKKMRIALNSSGAISMLRNKTDVLSADEMRDLVTNKFPAYQHLLGSANTDWQDEIYRNALSLNNNITVSGKYKSLPIRFGYGNLNQAGILNKSGYNRNTLSLGVKPDLFLRQLQLNLQLKYTNESLRSGNEKAITQALLFDPTQPKSTHLSPVMLQNLHDAKERINTLSTNVFIKYAPAFLPKLNLNVRYYSHQTESKHYDQFIDLIYKYSPRTENNFKYKINISEADLSYSTYFEGIKSKIDFTAGYANNEVSTDAEELSYIINDPLTYRIKSRYIANVTNSYFGNITYLGKNKYGFNASFRKNINSDFLPDRLSIHALGAGLFWNIKHERFLKHNDLVSDLIFTADVSAYNRLDSPYQFLHLMNQTFNPDIKAEEYKIVSTSIQFGIYDNRLSGTFSAFKKEIDNFLIPYRYYNSSIRPISDGERVIKGVEGALRYKALKRENASFDIGLNVTFQDDKLIRIHKDFYQYIYGANMWGLAIAPGYPAKSFYLFNQAYDKNGKLLLGKYVVKDGDPNLTKYIQKSPLPNITYGVLLASTFSKLAVEMLFRGAKNNYVQNYASEKLREFYLGNNSNYIKNTLSDRAGSDFIYPIIDSNFYLENASFGRLEYVQVAYNFGKVWKDRANLSLTASGQNLFVVSRYSGQDPEVANGLDWGHYPQPRTFSMGLQLSM